MGFLSAYHESNIDSSTNLNNNSTLKIALACPLYYHPCGSDE
jgi:hypothetical protein